MRYSLLFFGILCCWEAAFGQLDTIQEESIVLDSLYREDQFYVGATMNLLFNTPDGIEQSGFSGGLHLGYMRDMPVNKKRNVAIALGLGYSFNTYNQNLYIGEETTAEKTIFSSLSGVRYGSNRFVTHLVEAPLEFRWRTSTAASHKFYRIYTGIRMGYLYHFTSRYENNGSIVKQNKVEEVNPWRIGTSFAFGWNTFNFYVYYSLNPLFKNAVMDDGQSLEMNTCKIGLMFYIL
ncbi:porin family protein [Aquimarina hainanensis]|uniref:Porin family protein n=1 Tax=Aquimarina hainanensis TaxID=1578017 RepID=A0ABW5N922_9FLAO|nr:porin family protein [Aquimarina sp. TRL1]QKX05093.1 PorT family protein [Aquimarina sp. TRL1]